MQFEDGRHLIAFLANVARNKVIDEYRHAGSDKRDMTREVSLWNDDSDQPRELATASPTPSQVLEARDVMDRLRDAARVPPEILDLKAEGLTTREIGERLGLSERTVQRALEDLRQRVEQARLHAG